MQPRMGNLSCHLYVYSTMQVPMTDRVLSVKETAHHRDNAFCPGTRALSLKVMAYVLESLNLPAMNVMNEVSCLAHCSQNMQICEYSRKRKP